MRIQKWSVLSSPHVHKTAWSQFERRTHYRQLHFRDIVATGELGRRLIWYLQLHAPPDVALSFHLNDFLALNALDPFIKEAEIRSKSESESLSTAAAVTLN